jgi:hypothetical protein
MINRRWGRLRLSWSGRGVRGDADASSLPIHHKASLCQAAVAPFRDARESVEEMKRDRISRMSERQTWRQDASRKFLPGVRFSHAEYCSWDGSARHPIYDSPSARVAHQVALCPAPPAKTLLADIAQRWRVEGLAFFTTVYVVEPTLHFK